MTSKVTRCPGCGRRIDPSEAAMLDAKWYCWDCVYSLSGLAAQFEAAERHAASHCPWCGVVRDTPAADVCDVCGNVLQPVA
jgi:predicted RNA-binding Zn-ribbon protein involved in translation (DUF1610 family)